MAKKEKKEEGNVSVWTAYSLMIRRQTDCNSGIESLVLGINCSQDLAHKYGPLYCTKHHFELDGSPGKSKLTSQAQSRRPPSPDLELHK